MFKNTTPYKLTNIRIHTHYFRIEGFEELKIALTRPYWGSHGDTKSMSDKHR